MEEVKAQENQPTDRTPIDLMEKNPKPGQKFFVLSRRFPKPESTQNFTITTRDDLELEEFGLFSYNIYAVSHDELKENPDDYLTPKGLPNIKEHRSFFGLNIAFPNEAAKDLQLQIFIPGKKPILIMSLPEMVTRQDGKKSIQFNHFEYVPFGRDEIKVQKPKPLALPLEEETIRITGCFVKH